VVWMVGLADGLTIDINDGGKLCEKALLFSTHSFLPIFSTTNHRLTQSTRLPMAVRHKPMTMIDNGCTS
jgi:hypothetical protein